MSLLRPGVIKEHETKTKWHEVCLQYHHVYVTSAASWSNLEADKPSSSYQLHAGLFALKVFSYVDRLIWHFKHDINLQMLHLQA